jgi:hypothetical protein
VGRRHEESLAQPRRARKHPVAGASSAGPMRIRAGFASMMV